MKNNLDCRRKIQSKYAVIYSGAYRSKNEYFQKLSDIYVTSFTLQFINVGNYFT